MFSIRNKKRINRSYSPLTRAAVRAALKVRHEVEVAPYRPRSSQTRCGKFTRAIGKPNTAPAGSPRAVGSKPRLNQNEKHDKQLPVYVPGVYAG